MGSSTSKKMKRSKFCASKKLSTPSLDGFCECLAFRLQPFCTANRHMHAFIVDKTEDIVITDLTFKKRFLVKNALDSSEPLLNDAALPPGLNKCNLIAYHWDWAVVQIYHRNTVRFYVCNCSTQTCLYRYVMCPCVKRRPGLCGAYFTSDRNILILKASDIYYNLFSTASREIDTSFIEIVRLDTKTHISNHFEFPGYEMVPFGICPDPNKSRTVYLAFWNTKSCQAETNSPDLDLFTFHIGCTCKDTCVCGLCQPPNAKNTRSHTPYEFVRCVSTCSTDRSRLVNIQVPRNSNYLFQSAASVKSEKICMPNAARTYTIHVALREKTAWKHYHEFWYYDSCSGLQIDWPKLSPSGSYAFVGDEMVLSPNIGTLRSLSTICVDLLTELVLPEDVQFLPLPEKLRNLIKYGAVK